MCIQYIMIPCLSPVYIFAMGMRIFALDALLCLIVQFGQGLNGFRTDKGLYCLAVMNVANDRHNYWSASRQSFMKLTFSVLLPLEISEGNSNNTSHWRCFHFVWQLDMSHSLVSSQAALMKGLKLSRCPLMPIVSDLPLPLPSSEFRHKKYIITKRRNEIRKKQASIVINFIDIFSNILSWLKCICSKITMQ